MAKSKHSPKWKLARIQEYLDGKGSFGSIALLYGIAKTTLQEWFYKYQEHGISAFMAKEGNSHYSSEFKLKCIKAVITDEGSVNEITAKYNISDRSVLRSWIKRYNANMELKSYFPKRGVYMAEAHRKTTKEERLEIVQYCIEHENDYKNTAEKFNVSYSQVYNWVRKFKSGGEGFLADRRGKHKSDEEVDEMERLRRENLRLKQQLKEKDMTVELLKKVKEFERM